jgi:hypothetical protein
MMTFYFLRRYVQQQDVKLPGSVRDFLLRVPQPSLVIQTLTFAVAFAVRNDTLLGLHLVQLFGRGVLLLRRHSHRIT